MKKTVRVAAVLGVAALVLAGCGERPSDSDDTTASSDKSSIEAGKQYPNFKACMVSDSGGFDDKSFNQTSHDGLENAKKRHGIKTAEVESNSDAEYPGNIKALLKQGCKQITTVGFKLGPATETAAKQNPKVDFAIVDFAYFNEAGKNIAQPNVKGLTFNTDEPAFLAGYLAASQTETGKVGTFGGANIPTVTIFMNGFSAGVDKFNEMNDADVQVVGWDAAEQKGSFTEDFENRSKGQAIAETLIRQGADIIMPVAGPSGLGGLKAVKEADVKGIWVDTDGCVSAAEYCDVLLTSVMKRMDTAVEEAIVESIEGNTTKEPYVGTLANDGVALGPLHDFEDDVDKDVMDQIEEFKQQIIDGELKVSS
ncbi:MAG: BMP family ABC transporter substrate-binding protein [Nocardioides sp.]|nr:BMP family ABC transporter substrate-binding protein [Nocardioides sp.]